MGVSAAIRLACGIILLHTVHSAPKCPSLNEKSNVSKPFPNIEMLEIESYQMTVEYTIPNAGQTDYYVEYYDKVEREGKVEIHQEGKTSVYQYHALTTEAWEITGNTVGSCALKNASDTAKMFRDDMTEWRYTPDGKPDLLTTGPSAMFKNAFDVWNSSSENMVYMGAYEGEVRGLRAQYWRRCYSESVYIDYYFSTKDDDDAYEIPASKIVPLRVFRSDDTSATGSKLSKQQYEIMSFQPYISPDLNPFELPKGRGCTRKDLDEFPDLPDFKDKNLMFSAEVIYRKIDASGDDAQFTTYYSTISMALDLQSQHLAYYFTPWDTSKKDDDDVGDTEYIIYDMKHQYVYETKTEDGTCQIIRDGTFNPIYTLPENGGDIYLTDPSILYPNNELVYLSEGTSRGLRVNVFEEVVEGYLIGKKGEPANIDRAIISHSYLQDDEISDNVVSVKNALVQIQLMMRRSKEAKVFEVLTFNFFGFSTQLRDRRSIFDIHRCYKNDDDYLWATIGFNADPAQIAKVRDDIPEIQSNILNMLELNTELNPVRIPIVMVDINDGLFVTMMILNRPPVLLDYNDPVEDMKISGGASIGIENAVDCATKCLEEQDNCWGFSMCKAVCSFGVGKATTTSGSGCQFYSRYDNGSFIPSMETTVESLRSNVAENNVHLMLKDKDDNMVQLDATSVQITEPGEDDRLFDQIGNTLNPRMRVHKVGYKLKPVGGTPVKNLGKIRYDECQRLCLDFKTCETISYCLRNSECVISQAYADDIPSTTMEEDGMCNILTRKYADHFQRSPGNVLVEVAQQEVDMKTTEQCARACLTATNFQCLSFDHCPTDDTNGCKLHKVHYPSKQTREPKVKKSTNCGHYFRKFSTEFKRNPEKMSVGAKIPSLTNVTLEECAKACFEYGKGTCYGYDFCQDVNMLATNCQLLDSLNVKTTYSPICDNYKRTAEGLSEPRPYTNGYAGGIGFLCFIVGLLVGVAIVFTIAYLRVNRR